MNLRPFLSPGFGLILHAPETWQETSTEKHFQVIDPNTGTQFTASAYENPGISLEEWAQARLGMLAEGMPFLRILTEPYQVKGANWIGIATESRGVFPGQEDESYYLVLCIHSAKKLISFSIAATVDSYFKNEFMYKELLATKLVLVDVVPMGK